MAYHYPTRVFAGFGLPLSLGACLLLGGTGLALATTLLLPQPGSSVAPAAALPLAPSRPLPGPTAFGLLASLPTATWLPYPASASRAYLPATASQDVEAGYRPAAPERAGAATSAIRRSWNTIKRMFR